MSYSKQELVNLNALLSEMMRSVNEVISEGNATENEHAARWDDHEFNPDWTYYGGTSKTGAMRRKSLDLTRALAELRKP